MDTDPIDLRGARVLLVDDAPANLEVLFALLEPEGYEISMAPGPEIALRLVREAVLLPDLVLLDVMMPGLDGFEVCRRLKRDPRTRAIPVVFVTALDQTESVVRGFEVGGVDYIPKPFRGAEVSARVRTALLTKRLLDLHRRHQEEAERELRTAHDLQMGLMPQVPPQVPGSRLAGQCSGLAAAESATAYPIVTRRYRRTVAVLGQDSRDALVVDVFEVDGGAQHDWLLHGCRDLEGRATAEAASEPYAGTLLNPGVSFSLPTRFETPNPPGSGFGFITGLRHAVVQDRVVLRLEVGANPVVAVRSHLAGLGHADLYLGEAPDIRRARETNGWLERTRAPVVCLRRSGTDLQSVFAAVHEPVSGASTVVRVSARRQSGALLLEVDRTDGRRDYFALRLADDGQATWDTPHGPLTFAGGWAWVRIGPSGRLQSARLHDGTVLRLGPLALVGPCAASGQVLGWSSPGRRPGARGRIVLDRPLTAPGHGPLLLTFADGTVWPFHVVGVDTEGDATVVDVAERPALSVDGARLAVLSFPQRQIEGAEVRYRWPQLQTWTAGEGSACTETR